VKMQARLSGLLNIGFINEKCSKQFSFLNLILFSLMIIVCKHICKIGVL
jgi:hypothetical protein